MIDQSKQKAPTSADVEWYIEMMGVVTYGYRLEIFRAIADLNDPEDIKALKDFEEFVAKKGADTPYPLKTDTNKQSEEKI